MSWTYSRLSLIVIRLMSLQSRTPTCRMWDPSTPRRARLFSRDPVRARERVVSAAHELVAAHGATVTLSDIARRAADGLNTDCRRERRGLIDALLAQPLEELVALVSSAPERSAADDDSPPWLVELRASMPARLRDRGASLAEVAKALAMSPRTFQRRLAEAGTSWRAEVETARRGLAAALSAEGARNDAIAGQLGYSDARALRRAIRRWQGGRASNPETENKWTHAHEANANTSV